MTRSAFTLIDAILLIALAALLLLLALPALGVAKSRTQDEVCKANLRAAGQAIIAYAADDPKGYVPPGWDKQLVNLIEHVSPYLDRDISEGFGRDYMRCPTQDPTCWRTYRFNYMGVWGYEPQGAPPGVDSWTPAPPLADINPNKFMLADGHNRDWGRGLKFYSTGAISNHQQRPFTLNTDWDGDGMIDSAENQLRTSGPYNGYGAWHFTNGNMLFPDGRVETVTLEDYVNNRDGIMTPRPW